MLNCDIVGTGPALVFLHGLAFDRRIWRPIVDCLSGEFTCISVDLPGHGLSPDFSTYDLDSVAQGLKELIDVLQVARPIIIGHSLGSVIAAVYASKFATGAIVIVDQPMRFAQLARGLQQIESQLRGEGFMDFWKAFESSFGIETLSAENRRLVSDTSIQRQEVVLGYWEVLLSAADPEDVDRNFRPVFEAVKCPMLAIYGTSIDVDYHEWLSLRIPQVNIETWDHAGHFPYLMYPERFAEAVRRTLDPSSGLR